ncbi:ImmA/IrrE family metallo-endopeptidase [Glutamicibacter arilaitensis]|uniref:ImmA/IrrE family metallo-endopeptidase n=1 Tax=Glutamicibacter arilaitensis TaxID=256701 RepID=UPI00384B0C36
MHSTIYRTSPDHLATKLGIKVRSASPPLGWWGVYDHTKKLITLHPDLSPVQYRCTLMHELGHAHYGHQGVTGKQEAQANRWAAHQLLSLDDVMEHAKTELHAQELAALLGVLPTVLQTFVETLDIKSAERRLCYLQRQAA